MKRFAAVSVDVPLSGGSRVYHYSVPEELRNDLECGSPVLVPFGSRKARGFILGFPREPEVEDVRPILGRLRIPSTPEFLISLAGEIARRYVCQVGEALKGMVPPERKSTPSVLWVSSAPRDAAGSLPSRQSRLFYVLSGQPGGIDGTLACKRAKVPREVLLALERKGLARRLHGQDTGLVRPVLALNRIQLDACDWTRGISSESPSLLFGVTGSGKTHVYLETVARVLDEGRQAIFLVPEISLTTQIVESFHSHFGKKVALMHSRLSAGERYEEWRRMRKGEAGVAIGARSAVFAPFSRLGLIILDEEHESTYKQEETPRYHAREVALIRGSQEGAGVLMGSATPSVETYYQAQQGRYRLFHLGSRPEGREMPCVEVVDMRGELQAGNRTIFSHGLRDGIRETLDKGEQVILFLNRRGHSTFVLCRECGLVMKCPSCDVSLTLHAENRMLRCHYCDHSRRVPDRCPNCSGHYMRAFGTGTQKVEEEIGQAFPGARILRMDTDTTSRKGSHKRILEAFREGRADILVGTQMIAKGLDIGRVTLVGAIAADTALHIPDFRSAERTFQLLTQAAGRAGRGERPGRVIIQTYNPQHYSVEAARDQDYRSFYEREISIRDEMGYPPFRHLARLLCVSSSDEVSQKGAECLAAGVEYGEGLEVLGPSPAPIRKIKGKYRWSVLVKATDREELTLGLAGLMERVHGSGWPRGAKVLVDVDPSGVL